MSTLRSGVWPNNLSRTQSPLARQEMFELVCLAIVDIKANKSASAGFSLAFKETGNSGRGGRLDVRGEFVRAPDLDSGDEDDDTTGFRVRWEDDDDDEARGGDDGEDGEDDVEGTTLEVLGEASFTACLCLTVVRSPCTVDARAGLTGSGAGPVEAHKLLTGMNIIFGTGRRTAVTATDGRICASA
jgi:hypothetical protein